jgi:hypothetical protein
MPHLIQFHDRGMATSLIGSLDALYVSGQITNPALQRYMAYPKKAAYGAEPQPFKVK